MKNKKTKIWLENDRHVSIEAVWAAQEMGIIENYKEVENGKCIPKGKQLLYVDNLYYRKDIQDIYKEIISSDVIITESVYVQESGALLNRFIRLFGSNEEFQQKRYEFYSISHDNLLKKLNNLQMYSESHKNLGNAIKCITNNDVFECEMYNGNPKKIVFIPSECKFEYQAQN